MQPPESTPPPWKEKEDFMAWVRVDSIYRDLKKLESYRLRGQWQEEF